MSSNMSSSESHRLPFSLRSTYRQYKNDNSALVKWLVEASSRYCESNETGQGTSSCQGIPPRELLSMAMDIRSCRIEVPNRIFEKLRSVLWMRRRCSDWFNSRAESAADTVSNETHQFYIETLEKILETLSPASPVGPFSETFAVASIKSAAKRRYQSYVIDESEDVTKAGAHLSNMNLNPYDVLPAHTENDPDHDVDTVTENINEQSGSGTMEYEVELVSPEEDKVFKCFCILEDLNRLRTFIKAQWLDYKQGKKPLIAAALVTDQALGIARKFIEDFENAANGEECSYHKMFATFFLDLACRMRQSETKTELEGSLTETTKTEMKGSRTERLANGIVLDLDQMADVVDWIFLDTFLSLHEALLNLAKHPPVDRQHAFPTTFKRGPVSSQFPSETGALSEHLSLAVSFPLRIKGLTWLDSITGSFQSMVKENPTDVALDDAEYIPFGFDGVLSFSTIFAAQILVDIQRLLCDEGLAQAAIEVFATIKALKSTSETTINWTKNNVHLGKTDAQTALKVLETRQLHLADLLDVCRDESHKRIVSRNPVMAGLAVFHLVHNYYSWGCDFADSLGVLETMHCYNAARQEGALGLSIPDLDFVISRHTAEYLFLGDFPRSGSQYFKNFLLASGGTVVSQNSDVGRCRFLCRHLTDLLDLLLVLSRRSLKDRDERVEHLQLILSVTKKYGHGTKHLLFNPNDLSINAVDLRKLLAKERKLGPIALLTDLSSAVEDLVPEIYFDYSVLACRCSDLARSFEEAMDRKISKISFLTQNGNVDMYTALARVFKDLEIYDHEKRKPARKQSKNFHLYKTSLQVVSNLMKEWAEGGGDSASQHVSKRFPSFKIEAVDFTTVVKGPSKGIPWQERTDEEVKAPQGLSNAEMEQMKGLAKGSLTTKM
ncbi:hypothetical protein PV11_04409 [Exophiala sideris]|uniref:DUF6604 domain-containing protein n=1 Tax=Exophiala sideris TaxID=1016849 RepID=A0A0D1Z5Z0_9EURO|nr:hypothetical protein PV11_04409 [Exophiala sideris]